MGIDSIFVAIVDCDSVYWHFSCWQRLVVGHIWEAELLSMAIM